MPKEMSYETSISLLNSRYCFNACAYSLSVNEKNGLLGRVIKKSEHIMLRPLPLL